MELQEKRISAAGGQAEAQEAVALSFKCGSFELDYLAFLLDELVWERKWHREGGCARTLEKMIHDELDRWELGEKAELELACILAERNGASVTEPSTSPKKGGDRDAEPAGEA